MDDPIFKLEKVVQTRGDEPLEDFEGPLDLILYLLGKNKIEIQDIPIALILEQYQDYLEKRKQMDLEVASEFVTMAAHLMYIKTRMLLNLEDDQYTAFAASISSMMVRSYAVAIVKPAEGKTDAVKAALEAYVATARSDFSDALALKAIGDIFDSLLDSYHGDKEARGKMHIAQCLAGMAFSNALLGIAHSLAHKTGAVFHIPHGCCNAILLPSVIQYNSRVCMNRYAAVARYLGLPGGTDKQLTDSLVKAICALNKELGIEQTYQANGVSEELFKENAEAIAHNAVLDPCTLANPRPIDDEAMLKVLTCAYYGKPVTF